MTTVSIYRTDPQVQAIGRALSVGYVHNRDSDYKVNGNGCIRMGCMSILFGDVTGRSRSMIVYPDGSIDTAEQKRGGSKTVNYSKRKLIDALHSHGVLVRRVRGGYRRIAVASAYVDEDEVFAG